MFMLVNKRPYTYLVQMVLKCEFWKKKKFIFVSRVIESHSRPIKAKWRKIWLEWSSPLIWQKKFKGESPTLKKTNIADIKFESVFWLFVENL